MNASTDSSRLKEGKGRPLIVCAAAQGIPRNDDAAATAILRELGALPKSAAEEAAAEEAHAAKLAAEKAAAVKAVTERLAAAEASAMDAAEKSRKAFALELAILIIQIW